MGPTETQAMASRALLTEREREIISGNADVTDEYRYQTVSRVRTRIQEELPDDLEALAEHGDLLKDLQWVVCTDFDG